MSPRAAAAVDEPRRHGVLGALAAALPDRAPRRGDDDRPDLRVVAPAARRRRSWQVGTLAGGLLFLAMFAIVGAQTLIVQQQQHIDAVNDRIAAAETDAERLQIDLAELQSPERILSEAKDRLGMIQGPPPVYLLPQGDDDARAAEVPPTTPPTTVAKSTTPTTSGATKSTTPTTVAKATTTPTTSGATKSTTPTTAAKATTTPTTASKATTTPTTTAPGSGR